jgi:hypothetical protein
MTDRLIDLAAAAVQRAHAAASNVQQTEAAAQAVSVGSYSGMRRCAVLVQATVVLDPVHLSVTTPQLAATLAGGLLPSTRAQS